MIQLTRLTGETFHLNALYIEQVQSFPDCTITTTTGRKIVVKETEREIIGKITGFYKEIGLLGNKPEAGEKE
ncbi:flagellar FlbD family protein [Thalassobacillus pellis]|uniref:flagellar FlbD family protein n=1 Tax=Thalassobacillus pellis TaxID=748008 RepID=UPI0019601288|nr:flagellar FlbD family protein [Thalassobacillus pellis]MBM7552743.1 flagellar protein FlbD [Thalassobacillus pellis]